MADGYTTGAPELKSAAQELMDGNQDLMQQLSQLASSVDAVSSNWKGAAHTAFVTLTTKFQEDAKILNDKLIAIADQVTGSADAYMRQEEQASQSLSQITSTLDG